jgi:MOSC domain-containing protein YiiM
VGRLAAIARREASRSPMQLIEKARVSENTGVANDFRGKSRNRKVTVLSARAWAEVCSDLGAEIPWTTRRSNLLVDDIELPRRTGDIIQVGEVRLKVSLEINPCSRMDEQVAGLSAALAPDWRGGVGCVVLQGGTIRVGDEVNVVVARNGEKLP